ncbi:hypothetical protein PN499_05335 [Kamptonema animale CS-326]|jgi:predicted  nucleic acid-binding Zn-ribbon protein|uniref:hypothetical protein n=1 Tax=Kamptonema animale TaxID=92934 RepID=UPI00232AF5F0|nr:hypothetical protein [Kamptonema animale]MDB9510599.1 hypothetical protein [Kamptonema animale CS-326]
MTEPSNLFEERLESLRSQVQKVDTEFGRRCNILLDEIVVLTDDLNSLARKVDRLAIGQQQLQEGQQQMQLALANLSTVMVQMARNAEVDRAEIRRIWEYLETQQRTQGNGHG